MAVLSRLQPVSQPATFPLLMCAGPAPPTTTLPARPKPLLGARRHTTKNAGVTERADCVLLPV
jgi:hypothetical protein